MEDSMIVQLYFDRDESAISRTHEKYGAYCTSIANNILGCAEDAEECVNDTYIKAWNTIPPHRPGVLSTFLGKITRNLSFNKYKQNTAQKRGGSDIPAILDELEECVASTADNVENEMEYKELVKAIDNFLASLPQEKRNIFVCRYWYNESVAKIAKEYGMKENAVSMVLHRLRAKLKDSLIERGYSV